MRKFLIAAAITASLGAGAAHATTVSDPVGDFLPSFVGTPFSDLDITAFTAEFDAAHSAFDLSGSFAGPFNPTHTGLYIIGVDTGKGAARPFANIGEPNVIFDQAVVVRNTGVASLGAHTLSATFTGDDFSVVVPLAFLPPTVAGFGPRDYRFNLWARNGLGNNNQNADFAPQNATVTAVPEPAAWALMLFGFGMAGAALRGRRKSAAARLA